MTAALLAAVLPVFGAVLYVAFPPRMWPDEASIRLRAERDERAARAALRPERRIDVGPGGRP